MALTPEQERLFIVELEKMGESQVRSHLDHGKISPSVESVAIEWLASRERAKEAASSRMLAAAETQAAEARRANTRATIALVIAIISIIVSAIGIWLPHLDAHK